MCLLDLGTNYAAATFEQQSPSEFRELEAASLLYWGELGGDNL